MLDVSVARVSRVSMVGSVVALVSGCALGRVAASKRCSQDTRAALDVSVTDERGAPLSESLRVRVIAHDGAYADTAFSAGGIRSVHLAYERAGFYRVRVDAPGYLTSEMSDIVATKESTDCHVKTEYVVMTLHR